MWVQRAQTERGRVLPPRHGRFVNRPYDGEIQRVQTERGGENGREDGILPYGVVVQRAQTERGGETDG